MPDASRRLRPIEAVERDIVVALTAPTAACEFWVDLEEAARFVRERHAAAPTPLTLTHLYIKAAACAVVRVPDLHRMYGPFSAIDPAHADVGVSVLAGAMVEPVVVIQQANLKPLAVIASELRSRAAAARADAQRFRLLVDRYLWLFPFPRLRRAAIRAFLASARRRRQLIGTIQLSSMGRFDLRTSYLPMVPDILLIAGVASRQACVEGTDRIVARTGAMFALHGSHRKLNGRTAGAFVSHFRTLLQDPAAQL
jgi:pyruvate/2-oxoglutarate dehydrogenase complex dihydrolipoamide acyltransferase (E2) component